MSDRSRKMCRKDEIKSAIIKGKEHKTHKSNKIIPERIQKVNFICKCKENCSLLFTDDEKKSIFKRYNSLSTHHEQYELLKGLVIPKNKYVKRQQFNYFIEVSNDNNTKRESVCQYAFLNIMGLKQSSLRKKVQNKRNESEDKRGKHQNNNKKIPDFVIRDINDFLQNLPTEQSHYVKNDRKYLSTDFGSVANVHRVFIDIFPEYLKIVNYNKFLEIFNASKISFKAPGKDLCGTCEQFKSDILNAKQLKNNCAEIEKKFKEHKISANYFYMLRKDITKKFKYDKSHAILSFDFEKNLPLPVTNINKEYYLRQLWVQNFGIHDIKLSKACMFLYAENYAGKGPNEVISFIDYFIKYKLSKETEVLHLFCDNCFSQNKNKYLWLYFNQIVKSSTLDEINIYYPTPGHSFLPCDSDFGLIEKSRKKEKIFLPSQYVNIIKNANLKNPNEVIYVNYPLTNTLKSDGTEIAKVYDYKRIFDEFVRSQLDYCSEVKIIRFTKNTTQISIDLKDEPNISLNLYRKNFKYELFSDSLQNLSYAYNNFLPISREKLCDVNLLLKCCVLPLNTKFYDSLYSEESDDKMTKTKKKFHDKFSNDLNLNDISVDKVEAKTKSNIVNRNKKIKSN
jgi:hypothetical protein